MLYRHAYSVPFARLTHALLRHACGNGCERRGFYDAASLTMRFPFSVCVRRRARGARLFFFLTLTYG